MDDGVWRWVWRFNAVAIAGVAMIGGLLGAAGLYTLVREITSEKYVPNLVNVEPEAQASTRHRVVHFSKLGDTGLLWGAIERASLTPLRVSSKYAAATVDYLIYEPETGRSRRLLDLPEAMIVSARQLYQPDDDMRQGPALAIMVEYVDVDSNGDGRLSDEDELQLALARPDGTGLTRLAEMTRSLGVETLSDTEAVAMIETGDKIEALHLDLAGLSVSRRVTVAP